MCICNLITKSPMSASPPSFTVVLMPSTTRSNALYDSYLASFTIANTYQNDRKQTFLLT